METSITRQLVDFVRKTNYRDLPDKVIQDTKRLILDSVGCALGGLTMNAGRIVLGVVKDLGGKAESTLIGSQDKTTCVNSAYANAKLANLMDMDDFWWGGGHHSPIVIYSALAVAEREKATGKDLIAAVALGFEVGARSALVMTPPAFQMVDGKLIRPEFISFGHGIFGGVAAAGKLLRLSVDEMRDALGIAGVYAPAALAAGGAREVTASKYQLDWAAHGAVFAALLGQKGLRGPRTILDDGSFAKSMGVRTYLSDAITKDLGESWAITETGMKFYPSCRHCSYGVDLFAKIIEEQDIKPQEIEAVLVRGSKAITLPHISEAEPADEFKCQYSLPYSLAMVAYRVEPGPEWLDPARVKDPKIRKFAKKVKIEENPAASEAVREALPFRTKKLPTIVEVEARGKRFVASGEVARGEAWSAEARMTDEELTSKFKVNASPTLSHKGVQAFVKTIFSLEKVTEVDELTRWLRPHAD